MKEYQSEDIELQDILIDDKDVESNIKEKEEETNLLSSKISITDFISSEDSDIIKADISLLKEMGYDKKLINKVYIIMSPPNIEEAINIMTPINGIYQHDFYENIYQSKNKNLCFICNQPRNRHINVTPGNSDEINDNIINENNNNNNITPESFPVINYSSDKSKCIICYEDIQEDQKKFNLIPCGHICCTQCWLHYFKSKISEARVEQIKCVEYKCNHIISEEFILKHIKNDKILLKQYERFKLRAEILKDPNKRQCPSPDCDKYLQKSKDKYVKCENGHKFCFECLRPWHGKDSCEKSLEKDFMNWKKNKNLKQCPRCKIYTEKNEGCNHMTCTNCKFQWCWLCEGKYEYGHYSQGKCRGLQFSNARNVEEANRNRINRNSYYETSDRCYYCTIFFFLFMIALIFLIHIIEKPILIISIIIMVIKIVSQF